MVPMSIFLRLSSSKLWHFMASVGAQSQPL